MKNIFKASLVIALAIFSSRILGLIREIIQTNYFGLTAEFASYQSARLIPNMLRELLAEGAFSTAFITIFAGMVGKKSKEEILIFVNKTLFISLTISILISIALFFLAPLLIPVLHRTEETMSLTIDLFRIMLPFLTIISLSSIFMGFLNSYNKFGVPAWAPFFSNVFFIVVIVLFKDRWGIYTLSIALICGGLAQFLFQLPSFIKNGYKFRLVDLRWNDDLKRFFSLFLPFVLTMSIPMLYTIVSNPLVTAVSDYGNTVLSRAFFLIRFVVSIVALSIGTVSLPNLSKYFSNEEYSHFISIIRQAFSIIIVIALPIIGGAMLLSDRATSFVWRDITFGIFGNLDEDKLKEIGFALFLYSPGILFSSFNAIIHRAFQSMKLWFIPLVVGLGTVILHFGISAVLVYKTTFGFNGVALSFSIVSMINFVVLFGLLQGKMKAKFQLRWILPNFAKSLFSVSVMVAVLYLLKRFISDITLFGNAYLNRVIIFLGFILIGAVIYLALLILLKETTIKSILEICSEEVEHLYKNAYIHLIRKLSKLISLTLGQISRPLSISPLIRERISKSSVRKRVNVFKSLYEGEGLFFLIKWRRAIR